MSPAEYLGLLILFVLVWIFWDIAAGGDREEIGRNEDVSHLWGSRLRGVAMVLPAVARYMGPLSVDMVSGGAGAIIILAARMILLWLLLCVEGWVVFDLRLNLRRGLRWDYIGEDRETASSDKSAAHYLRRFKRPGVVYLAIKLAAFAALLGAYILLR